MKLSISEGAGSIRFPRIGLNAIGFLASVVLLLFRLKFVLNAGGGLFEISMLLATVILLCNYSHRLTISYFKDRHIGA